MSLLALIQLTVSTHLRGFHFPSRSETTKFHQETEICLSGQCELEFSNHQRHLTLVWARRILTPESCSHPSSLRLCLVAEWPLRPTLRTKTCKRSKILRGYRAALLPCINWEKEKKELTEPSPFLVLKF
jgi:hypothetical protein